MGKILTPDGQVIEFRLPHMNFRYQFLQEQLGGSIEPQKDLPGGFVLLFGDRLLGEARLNLRASILARHPVAGRAILLEPWEAQVELT